MTTDPFVSVEAAIAADDLDRAADLVERLAEALVAGRRPWLLYYAAWVASALRQQRLAALTLARAASAFEAAPQVPQRDRGRILVRLAQGVVAERDGRLDDARAAFADARALLSSARRLPDGVHSQEAQRWRSNDPS